MYYRYSFGPPLTTDQQKVSLGIKIKSLQEHLDNLKLDKQMAQQFNIFRDICKSKSVECTSMQQQLDEKTFITEKSDDNFVTGF